VGGRADVFELIAGSLSRRAVGWRDGATDGAFACIGVRDRRPTAPSSNLLVGPLPHPVHVPVMAGRGPRTCYRFNGASQPVEAFSPHLTPAPLLDSPSLNGKEQGSSW